MNDLPEPVEHPPYHESQDLMMLLDPNAPTIPLPEVAYFTATADHLRPSKPHLVLARWLNHRVSLPVWLLALALIFLLAGAVPILRANPLTQGHATPSSAARMSTTTSSPARGIHIPQWTTVQTFTGYGNANTAPFTITVAAWNIVWSCDPRQHDDSYGLSASLVIPGDQPNQDVVDITCQPDDQATWHGETAQYVQGTFYLAVSSDASWTLAIQVPR